MAKQAHRNPVQIENKLIPTIDFRKVVEASAFEKFILAVIVVNAVTLGLETSPDLSPVSLGSLHLIDKVCLVIFSIELALKGFIYRSSFLKDPWRVFDLLVVGVALIPATGMFSVVRALRVLRTLRMVSVVPSLRRVISGLLNALPGLGSVGAIMLLIFYVGSVMATKLFGEGFPEWFGTLGESAYSLFQIMTLESWSMGVVRPVMEKFPFAWAFFLPFILIATFTMLNLFIAVIVNAMQAETDKAAMERAERSHDERELMLQEIRDLNHKVDLLLSINKKQ
jgi:voltage-gated sodium channel